jgi:glycogen debranching enzyme
MQDVIKVEDQYYILVSSSRTARKTAVLKYGDTFAVFDAFGDIAAAGVDEPGLYHGGTRFLSRLTLRFGTARPLLLSSRTSTTNDVFGADLTNQDVLSGEDVVLARDLVHLFRTRLLAGGRCIERVRLVNYAVAPIVLPLTFAFAADFVDIFEVRGTRRPARGTMLPVHRGRDFVEIAYEGLDQRVRRTRLTWSDPPDDLHDDSVRFVVALEPQETRTIELTIACDDAIGPALDFDRALTEVAAQRQRIAGRTCAITSSSEQFTEWVTRSWHDLEMLMTDTPHGAYPYAGVPWFSTPFGRDGIITALEVLWSTPSIARGVLQYLAATQATDMNAAQDAEPGKILHETRSGEMAALGEVPFGRYYGSIDSTPLFILLAGEYYKRTADIDFAAEIWPNVERALEWIEEYGDRDGDGFIEYARRSRDGLVQQGWKDSNDAVFHADGTLAEAPIALCEVQAYAYAARQAAAALARALGFVERADGLQQSASNLRDRFEEAFWCDELGTYALALDGGKRQCRVLSSNAGHCLFAGIATRDHALATAEALTGDRMFTGWGIRTIAAGTARYNPMSYHNGSIWPHDNALAAAGFARYGLGSAASAVLASMLDVSHFVDLRRMPELFCGFRRRKDEGPTLYPVACAPQAWAAGAVFLLLQSCLGLSIDAGANRICVVHPQLPSRLDHVTVRGLSLGEGRSVDLLFERRDTDVALTVLQRTGDVAIAMIR